MCLRLRKKPFLKYQELHSICMINPRISGRAGLLICISYLELSRLYVSTLCQTEEPEETQK